MNHYLDRMKYFPLDAETVFQPDLASIACKYHSLTYHFYLYLLCQAYRTQGYFIEWSEMDADYAKRMMHVRATVAILNEIVGQFLKAHIFDREMYEKYGVLTSKDMQTNFYAAISKRKGQEQESYDYWLLGELKFARPNLQKS